MQVVEQHSATVHRLACRLSGNRRDAEDRRQDTFVRVLARTHASSTPGTLEGRLHRPRGSEQAWEDTRTDPGIHAAPDASARSSA